MSKPGHPVFLELLKRMEDTHVRKGADYSNPSDILSNLRACERFGVPPHKGILVRMSDKWERIQNLIRKEGQGEGPAVSNESLEDSLEDLANYALLMIVVRRERLVPVGEPDIRKPETMYEGKPDRIDGKPHCYGCSGYFSDPANHEESCPKSRRT